MQFLKSHIWLTVIGATVLGATVYLTGILQPGFITHRGEWTYTPQNPDGSFRKIVKIETKSWLYPNVFARFVCQAEPLYEGARFKTFEAEISTGGMYAPEHKIGDKSNPAVVTLKFGIKEPIEEVWYGTHATRGAVDHRMTDRPNSSYLGEFMSSFIREEFVDVTIGGKTVRFIAPKDLRENLPLICR